MRSATKASEQALRREQEAALAAVHAADEARLKEKGEKFAERMRQIRGQRSQSVGEEEEEESEEEGEEEEEEGSGSEAGEPVEVAAGAAGSIDKGA